MIYMLRKKRMELVTGDAGEHVFGEGLKAALDELNRLEEEYLALFLGKQFRQKIVREYDVIPEREKIPLSFAAFPIWEACCLRRICRAGPC